MNSDIVSKYSIKFGSVWEKYMGKMTLIKYPYIEDERLFDFLNAWRNPSYINEDLLPAVDDAINGRLAVEENDISGGATLIILNSTVAKTYDINVTSLENPISVIPIHDFKQIVEGWRDFL